MPTRWGIGEQVLSLLSGGKGKEATTVDIREIYPYIAQVLNSLLKLDYFKTTLDGGETTPDGLALATYNNVPVIGGYQNTAHLYLPCNYIRLPMGLGIYYIGPQKVTSPANILTSQFVPIPMGAAALMASQPEIISNLGGRIGYEPHGLEMIFTQDITQPPLSILQCIVKLVVMDMNSYGDYDLLPIPADMEAQCVQQAYQLFSGEKPPSKITDPIAIVKSPGQ
jgi:hypothetical protein